MKDKVNKIKRQREKLLQGGGKRAIARQHAVGRLTARERINKLLDPGSFMELDLFAGSAKGISDTNAIRQPGDGVITGYGEIANRPVFVWSQDATVLGGSIGAVHARKITMVINEALKARIPTIGIVDSIGERVEDIIQYPHSFSLESICNLQVKSSGVIPQIVLVMGPCTGGMALSAALADFVFLVRNTSYMHVAPPPDGISHELLGEAWMHAEKTGCYDVFAESDEECLQKCVQLLGYLPANNEGKPPSSDTFDEDNRRGEELLELVPTDLSIPYSMHALISLIVDNAEFFEIKQYWARNLITGFARMGGYTVGIIANNPQDKGGCMNLDASDKMARFTRFCDAFNFPLIWLADCPAFYPSVSEETRGLIRHGSRVIFTNATATVPQITVIIRKLYGGGGLAMPGKRLGGDLMVAWPTLSRGLMGAEGAVATLYDKELKAIADEAERKKQRRERIQEMRGKLEQQQIESTQAIIDPRDTRSFIIKSLRMLARRKQELPPRKHDNIRL